MTRQPLDGIELEGIARACHEANRAMQVTLGEEVNPHWDDLSDDLRASSISGVCHALNGASAEELHESWARERIAHGWRHGETLDREAKVHPALVPYDELPALTRVKDRLFRHIVLALSAEVR